MSWAALSLLVLPLAAVAINAALAGAAWQRRGVPGAREFACLTGALACWALTYGLRLAASDLAAQVLLLKAMYGAVAVVPVAWLAFALRHTGQPPHLVRSVLVLPALLSATTVILAWTNEQHYLVWTHLWQDASGPVPMLVWRGGPWYWVNFAYTYVTLALATVLLVRRLARSRRLYRRQAAALALGVLAPCAATVAYVLRVGPWPAFDPTSASFAVTGLAFGWGLLRVRLLDLAPVTLDVNIEGMSDAVLVLDAHRRVVNLNTAAGQVIGQPVDAAIGQSVATVLPGWPEAVLHPACTDDAPTEHTTRDESARVHDVRVSPIRSHQGQVVGWLIAARDVTERRHLERQLRQAQKMEAVGQLAGGVAHDFNNLLTAINGFADLLLDSLAPHDPARRWTEQIAHAAQRAADLTRQLLAFSRRQVLAPQLLDLNEVVTHLDPMLRRLIGEHIRVSIRSAPALGPVKADRSQIEQVVVNLAVNARDAMPGGGVLTIETSNVELDETYARVHEGATAGSYVRLALSDTGLGMDTTTQARIFEPFFTTKEQGKGTGLGLATVYGIVRQSGGHIWVHSEVGRGSAFKVYLPRASAPAATAAPAPGNLQAPDGTETVLLVEDQDGVRALSRAALERRGYRVLEARDGREALALGARETAPIHLLLTDVVMPEMSGPEIVRRMRAVRPGLRAVMMSGYAEPDVVAPDTRRDGAAFLEKPFSPDALARVVRQALDAPCGGAGEPEARREPSRSSAGP